MDEFNCIEYTMPTYPITLSISLSKLYLIKIQQFFKSHHDPIKKTMICGILMCLVTFLMTHLKMVSDFKYRLYHLM